MNETLDQVSWATLPRMCCSWPREITEYSVLARPLRGKVRRGRVALVRKKDEEGLDMTGMSLITRFSRQC